MTKNDISFNVNPAAAFAGFGETTEQKPATTKTGRLKKKLPKPDFIKSTHYTLDEAQKKLGLCYNTFKKLLDAGEITRVRHGRPYYVPIKDVEAYLKNHFKK